MIGCKKSARRGEPIYQAIEAERENFYELTLSPSMVDDHMPGTCFAHLAANSPSNDCFFYFRYTVVCDGKGKLRNHRVHPAPEI